MFTQVSCQTRYGHHPKAARKTFGKFPVKSVGSGHLHKENIPKRDRRPSSTGWGMVDKRKTTQPLVCHSAPHRRTSFNSGNAWSATVALQAANDWTFPSEQSAFREPFHATELLTQHIAAQRITRVISRPVCLIASQPFNWVAVTHLMKHCANFENPVVQMQTIANGKWLYNRN